MGTYLSLTLKNRSQKNCEKVNKLWNSENPGYENTFHIVTRDDIWRDIVYIAGDPSQAHLRYIDTPEKWNEEFSFWGYGQFQVKITLGDYLCAEMAKRYKNFITNHKELFIELPSDYVFEILEEAIVEGKMAENCLVHCKFCKPDLCCEEGV